MPGACCGSYPHLCSSGTTHTLLSGVVLLFLKSELGVLGQSSFEMGMGRRGSMGRDPHSFQHIAAQKKSALS